MKATEFSKIMQEIGDKMSKMVTGVYTNVRFVKMYGLENYFLNKLVVNQKEKFVISKKNYILTRMIQPNFNRFSAFLI